MRPFIPDIKSRIVLEEINAKWLTDFKPDLDGYKHSEQQPRDDDFGVGLLKFDST